jgi:disulfide bond formation protein DsbB
MKTQVKKGWGIVAVIGVVVALTMGDNLIMAAIGTIMLALGAWLGGYMNGECGMQNDECKMQDAERRAA